jgi:hypothetical protein
MGAAAIASGYGSLHAKDNGPATRQTHNDHNHNQWQSVSVSGARHVPVEGRERKATLLPAHKKKRPKPRENGRLQATQGKQTKPQQSQANRFAARIVSLGRKGNGKRSRCFTVDPHGLPQQTRASSVYLGVAARPANLPLAPLPSGLAQSNVSIRWAPGCVRRETMPPGVACMQEHQTSTLEKGEFFSRLLREP